MMAIHDDLVKWLEPRFNIAFSFPTDDHPKYRATIEEFGLSVEGDTPDEAYEVLLIRMAQVVAGRYLRGESLPDRSKWRKRGIISSDGGDG